MTTADRQANGCHDILERDHFSSLNITSSNAIASSTVKSPVFPNAELLIGWVLKFGLTRAIEYMLCNPVPKSPVYIDTNI